MKRVLLIFFALVLTVGACFAGTGDTIELTTSIGKEVPSFSMAGLYKASSEDAPGSITVASPADESIVLSVSLKQSSDSRYKGTYKLTVEATPFINQTTGLVDQTTGVPSAGARTLLPEVAGKIKVSDSTSTSSTDTDKTTVAITVEYAGPKVIHADLGNIASWDFTWPQVESLASGDYKATVKLTYEAV